MGESGFCPTEGSAYCGCYGSARAGGAFLVALMQNIRA